MSYITHIVIEIRPHRTGGWQVFAGEGVQPTFPERPQAIRHAIERSRSYHAGEIQLYNKSGTAVQEVIPFEKVE